MVAYAHKANFDWGLQYGEKNTSKGTYEIVTMDASGEDEPGQMPTSKNPNKWLAYWSDQGGVLPLLDAFAQIRMSMFKDPREGSMAQYLRKMVLATIDE